MCSLEIMATPRSQPVFFFESLNEMPFFSCCEKKEEKKKQACIQFIDNDHSTLPINFFFLTYVL